MSDLPMGYILKSVKVEPEKIEVSGNSDIIGNMTYLSTENISLANIIVNHHLGQNNNREINLDIAKFSLLKFFHNAL